MIAVAGLEQLTATLDARQKRFEDFVHREAIRLIPVLDAKTPDARETSVAAVAALAPAEAKSAGLVPSKNFDLGREALIAQFS